MIATDVIHLDVPASTRYLNVVGACIAEMLSRVEGLRDLEITTYNIQLAVHEGCTNIVDHAYMSEGGRIRIDLILSWQPLRLTVDLHDSGRSFNPDDVPPPMLDEPQVRGYGIFLMRQIMDEVKYEPNPGHNRWRLVKNL